MRVAKQVAGPRLSFRAVTRGDLVVAVVERGSLEPVQTVDVACRVKARGKDGAAATIKWLVEDGSIVKKGERVAELDSDSQRDQLLVARAAMAEVEAALARATEGARLARREVEIEVRLAEIDVELAAAELKDPLKAAARPALQLKLEKAKLLLERAKTQAAARTAQADADLRAREAARELAAARLQAAQAELSHCVLTAPMDGLATYPASPGRFAAAAALAVGEAVREGQTLLRVADVSRLVVVTRVHEAQISTVRGDQTVEVRVDAFPERALKGNVAKVATVASQSDWMTSDIKVYPVTIALEETQPGLKPGMSAEVRIVTAEKKGVLQAPVQAILGSGRERFCFVKVGEELHERKLTLGSAGPMAVEVTDGLKEGDEVLANPRAALPRVVPEGKGGSRRPEARGPGSESNVIVVRSIRPPDDDRGRTFVQRYGLTRSDLEKLAELPSVKAAVPLRTFPSTISGQGRQQDVTLVATTADLGDIHRLEPVAGRFLTADDDERLNNVVVLGKAMATVLFGDADPLGQWVALGGHSYQVVGVLRGQSLLAEVVADVDRAAFIPLRTCNARLGELVYTRKGGTRQAEAVQVSAVVLAVSSASDVEPTSDAARKIFEADKERKKDWQVVTPGR
jgi:RND family efflux transporter MFP subunit